MPLDGSYEIPSPGGRMSLEEAGELYVFEALAACRVKEGIYEFHPAILSSVEGTPADADLPVEVLRCLPEWCVYVPTPGADSSRSNRNFVFRLAASGP